jgi:hypothetical protein
MSSDAVFVMAIREALSQRSSVVIARSSRLESAPSSARLDTSTSSRPVCAVIVPEAGDGVATMVPVMTLRINPGLHWRRNSEVSGPGHSRHNLATARLPIRQRRRHRTVQRHASFGEQLIAILTNQWIGGT